MKRQNWTRDELIVAFNLYCKLRFGQYHRNNPQIIELANLLGRTPSAVAMKLCNFASFDPTHQKRGISGLSNAAKSDGIIWNEFNRDWNALALESEEAYLRLKGLQPSDEPYEIPTEVADVIVDLLPPAPNRTEVERLTKVRLCQVFFRNMILAGYSSQCCVCTLPLPQLLVASHIVPWSIRPELRVNPRNGLCLCALHDRAFDRGFLGIDQGNNIVVSTTLDRYLPHDTLEQMFVKYSGKPIVMPEKFKPASEFLDYHRVNIFSP